MRLLKVAGALLAVGILAACSFTPKEEAAPTAAPDPTEAPPTAAPAAEPSPSPAADPQPTEAPASDNPLLNLQVVTVPLMSGDGSQQVGERAYVLASAELLTEAATPEQFHEFVDTAVRDRGCNWFTVDLNDGTGLVFNSCSPILFEHGTLAEDGTVAESIGLYALDEGGHFSLLADDE